MFDPPCRNMVSGLECRFKLNPAGEISGNKKTLGLYPRSDRAFLEHLNENVRFAQPCGRVSELP
jgi:hypothetical protein